MIPKIAHFHWTGPPMSWLRLMGISTFVRHNPDWEVRIHGTAQEVRRHKLQYGQEADWTWWLRLHEVGGLQVATDIVWLRPIPDEWLESELAGCMNGSSHFYHNAAFGAVPGHPFIASCLDECARIVHKAGREDYQAFGPTMLRRLPADGFSAYNIPMNALCPITDVDARLYWREKRTELPENCVGAHWYGGHESNLEWATGPDSWFFVCKLVGESLA